MSAEIIPFGTAGKASLDSETFSGKVSALLEHVEYRRCDSDEDLAAIYRLRYRAYAQNGFIPVSASQKTSDDLDETPNCYRFGVFVDNELVSTVRLHHVTHREPYGPIMSVFGDLLQPRLARGESFINPTLLAADPDCLSTHKALPYLTLRLAVMANTYFNTTNCVCVIRREHAAFYRRVFGAHQVGDPRPYPPFTVPVLLYDSDCSVNMERTLQRFPFFQSTAIERHMLFQRVEQEKPGLALPAVSTPGVRAHPAWALATAVRPDLPVPAQ